MRKPKLYFMVGCQRSGKSTYSQQWLRNGTYDYPRSIINADSLRLAVHGERYHHETEPMIFAMDSYFIKHNLLLGMDVLVDETSTTERAWRRMFSIDIDAQPIVIDTPLEVCLERAVLTNQTDLFEPIKRCHSQLQMLKAFGIDNAVAAVRNAVKNGIHSPVLEGCAY